MIGGDDAGVPELSPPVGWAQEPDGAISPATTQDRGNKRRPWTKVQRFWIR
jgi:hypothetical protein